MHVHISIALILCTNSGTNMRLNELLFRNELSEFAFSNIKQDFDDIVTKACNTIIFI